ncbi:hypothetical protein NDU88_006076 [Pleurodeles waltl]|uniref:Uncharacterized protein n=1 Tax=Pleurodeles waltl TaxID=8319 RepID=A0AAV7L6E6_PLEWA|nr:hypothetical protein NDU88_006076 [Pleurodeles waltl]
MQVVHVAFMRLNERSGLTCAHREGQPGAWREPAHVQIRASDAGTVTRRSPSFAAPAPAVNDTRKQRQLQRHRRAQRWRVGRVERGHDGKEKTRDERKAQGGSREDSSTVRDDPEKQRGRERQALQRLDRQQERGQGGETDKDHVRDEGEESVVGERRGDVQDMK